jgi:glycosyltransferase involved in cell wall biosynthesis
MEFPKVLIIGQPFNKKNGGGVTISNLFQGWPKDRLAVVSSSNLINDLDTAVCENYYQLGYNGKLHPFPLNIILPKIKCGLLQIDTKPAAEVAVTPKAGGRFNKVYQLLTAGLHFFGLFHIFYKLKITPDFSKWIAAYNPDIIYTQLSTLELIRFVSNLNKQTNKKVAIHIMDDWPLTINKPGLFSFYWKKIIDKEFRQLINKAAVLMSICEAMSDEYKVRYKRNFIPFHNPIDVQYWMPPAPKNFSYKENFTILYAGRIGFGIEQSIAEIAVAITELAKIRPNIIFEIQTGDITLLNNLAILNENVKWIKPLAYKELPVKFSTADLLVLPQDFDEASINFLKYSFPTKVSEYMISGTPIMVYGSAITALTKYAVKYKMAHIVTEQRKEALINAIDELYNNVELRQLLSEKAQKLALETEDAKIVRENFRRSFL